MRQYLLLFPLLFSSTLLFGFNSNELIRLNSSPNVRLTVTPTPVNADESAKVVLDKNAVCNRCPPGVRPRVGSNCDSNMLITVSAVKIKDTQFKYKYTVSGGRVIGEGAEVVWDITGAQPGTYQIKVDAENKSSGQNWTETKMITVGEDECGCGLCECPIISVDASTSLTNAGETMTFTANVSGGSASNVTYNWKVSDGEIVEGQGTPVIRVATSSKMAGKIVKATVEIEGVCEECPKTESAEGSVANSKP